MDSLITIRIETGKQHCFDLRMYTNHVFRALKDGVREAAETDADKRKAETVCTRLDHQFQDAIQAIDRAEQTQREFLQGLRTRAAR